MKDFPGIQKAALFRQEAIKACGEVMSWTGACLEVHEDAVILRLLCLAVRPLQSWTVSMQRIFINEVTVTGRVLI